MHGAVAVKIARPGEREMLEDEGKIYNAFPRKLQEGCSQTPIPPVVPKFYGYYVPSLAEFDGKAYDELNDEEKDHVRCMINRISPILLLEQCGEQFSGTVGGADREKIAALLSHLHDANFVQGSMYKRNIVMQPGPLTLPQTQRSLREPSFRIIDFGRGKCCNPKVNYVNKEDWVDEAEHERNKVVEWTLR
ncbi:hypothetical protein F5148DRAFT_436827 [Russula earlei]|uniref:Uncharacterized protein n=1 Tax=Russula earlei TaxID=71964 RepID=A0ACC0UHM8_9AGAM|nr:hypothetical protein F5148DRAFT_436827 [Russula earlei]